MNGEPARHVGHRSLSPTVADWFACALGAVAQPRDMEKERNLGNLSTGDGLFTVLEMVRNEAEEIVNHTRKRGRM